MSQLAKLWFTLVVVASVLPFALAGPACARRHYKAQNCIQLCKSRWGFPGHSMGSNPWGPVMEPSSAHLSMDDTLSQACGTPAPVSSDNSPGAVVSGSLSNGSGASGSPNDSAPLNTGSSPGNSSPLPPPPPSPSPSPSTTSAKTTTKSQAPIAKGAAGSAPDRNTKGANAPNGGSNTNASPSPSSAPSSDSGGSGGGGSSVNSKPSDKSSGGSKAASSSSSASASANSNGDSASASASASSSASSSSDQNQYLSAHNSFRAKHGAGDLTWSDELAGKAQQWANGCKFEHSGGSLGPFGENLAAGTGDNYNIQSAIKSWTDESKDYNPTNPVPSHFTQVVWKGSKQLGCALALCDGIFDASFGKAKFFVCEYSSQGNIVGQFAQNVQA